MQTIGHIICCGSPGQVLDLISFGVLLPLLVAILLFRFYWWANNCKKTADMLRADDMPCVFCGEPSGGDPVIDVNGSFACQACGQAEFAAQAEEALMKS